ncbi:MAG: response regulator [Litorilinea sp.]
MPQTTEGSQLTQSDSLRPVQRLSPHILLIDNEEKLRESLRQELEQVGNCVTCAANGRIAMHLYRSQPFDLVITELIMPERDGLEVIMDLRKRMPDVKIIAISGGGQMGLHYMLSVAEKLGAQRALAKPFSSRQLLRAVQEVLALPI